MNKQEMQQYEEIGSPLSVSTIKHQIQVIQEVMKDTMVKDTHYGVIPGCGDKPTLLKAGAEKLCLTFRLSPTYVVEKTELGNGHREYSIRCTLTHIPSESVFGEGVGTCSTMESKFRYRKAERVCPECGSTAIIKGRKEYGGGWLCFAKKGGCGAKFGDNDSAIVDQVVGRVEHPDIADIYNTVLKIAKKRAHVDGVLTATAASDIFAQDLEDLPRAELTPKENSQPDNPEPEIVVPEEIKNEVHDKTLTFLGNNDAQGMKKLWDQYDIDAQVVLWKMFNSAQQNRIKKLQGK
jgi:DNA-directed RNA polymerase subunit RPC12/RpoP